MRYFLLIAATILTSGSRGQWTTVGGGLSGGVGDLHYDNNTSRLYAAGEMRYGLPDTVEINGIGYWHNGSWHPVGSGVTPLQSATTVQYVYNIAFDDSTLYAGGAFWEMAGVPYTMQLAYWRDSAWHSMGQDTFPFVGVQRLSIVDNELHLLGAIDTIEGTSINAWAIWDGQDWHPGDTLEPFYLSNTPGWTKSLIRYQGDLYMGGNFVTNLGANDIARKTPAGWEALGPGLLGDPWVNDMVEYDGLLWVAGEFYRAWGNPSGGVMAWDGTQWLDLFPQINMISQCHDVDVIDGKLYFTGSMQVAGKPDLYRIAVYDGQQLCIIGGPNIWAAKIAGNADTLYASMCSHLYCAVQGPQINYIGKWPLDAPADTCFQISTGVQAVHTDAGLELSLFPNPVGQQLTLALGGRAFSGTIIIHDAMGRKVEQRQGNLPMQLEVGHLEPGCYLLVVADQNGDQVAVKRFVKE